MDLEDYLPTAVEAVKGWERRWGEFQRHEALAVDDDEFRAEFQAYLRRLQGNYPFFHPRYAGQMLKPPHPVAVAGYVAAMLINPNNHALDGGPPTSEMEKEVVAELGRMFHFPSDALGHLTSSGTIANLEAAWVARELHPQKAIAFSDQAHYTHERLGDVLRLETRVIPSDPEGRVRLDVLEDEIRKGGIGTVVMTAGTTAAGVVDPIGDVLTWRDRYGIRVHVDAAYGGFFALLAGDASSPLGEETRRHLNAVCECDSVAVDPHKHGLQPYGCGCILFRDPRVGRVYKHESPYTYFTSDALHLGEISFECSRAGAAAGALWLTLRMFPLHRDGGFSAVLAAGVRAARRLHEAMSESAVVRPYLAPELDIVTYYPIPADSTTSAVDRAGQSVFEHAMSDPDDPVFLSVMRVESARLAARHADLQVDNDSTRILRSVLMKPEHEGHVGALADRIIRTAEEVRGR